MIADSFKKRTLDSSLAPFSFRWDLCISTIFSAFRRGLFVKARNGGNEGLRGQIAPVSTIRLRTKALVPQGSSVVKSGFQTRCFECTNGIFPCGPLKHQQIFSGYHPCRPSRDGCVLTICFVCVSIPLFPPVVSSGILAFVFRIPAG